MQLTSPLSGVRIKIDRAKKHLDDLKAAIDAFHKRQPYAVVTEIDPKTKHEIYRFRISECIPIEWGSIIGDCVHNLRSSLDIMANALVSANNGTPTRYTAFPIGSDRANFENSTIHGLDGASDPAIRLVKRLKPYGGADGNKLLYQMHSLDIVDKHRILVPVFAAHQDTVWSPITADMKEMGISMANWPAWSLKPKGGFPFPVKDGAILGRYGRGPADIDHSELKFFFQITFDKGQIFDREPIVPTLQQLIDFTERLIGIFAKHLFKCTW